MRANKVPAPSTSFWSVKVLTTGFGEALSDFLVRRFDPVPTVLVTAVVFAVVLAVQLTSVRSSPWRYWGAVVMVAVFGTMAADAAHVAVGVPYRASTLVFALALVVVFVGWRRTAGSFDVHHVDTLGRELWYWAAVAVTFALGTAVGDLVASSAGLGFLAGGLLFLAGIAGVVVARGLRILGPVAAFWAAYVLTRPLGASFADWVAVAPSRGGLGAGTGLVSAVLAIVILAAVSALASGQRRGIRPGGQAAVRS